MGKNNAVMDKGWASFRDIATDGVLMSKGYHWGIDEWISFKIYEIKEVFMRKVGEMYIEKKSFTVKHAWRATIVRILCMLKFANGSFENWNFGNLIWIFNFGSASWAMCNHWSIVDLSTLTSSIRIASPRTLWIQSQSVLPTITWHVKRIKEIRSQFENESTELEACRQDIDVTQ